MEFTLATIQKIKLATSKMSRTGLEDVRVMNQFCRNPLKPECESMDIELCMIYEGAKIPVCRSCWQDIAKTNLEW